MHKRSSWILSTNQCFVPYLAGQVRHAVAATHAGCGWHSNGWVWGSTLPPPVLLYESLKIQTTVNGRRRLWGVRGHIPPCVIFSHCAADPALQSHQMTYHSFNTLGTVFAHQQCCLPHEILGPGCLINNWKQHFPFSFLLLSKTGITNLLFCEATPTYPPQLCPSSLELT